MTGSDTARAAQFIRNAHHCIAFTGAGISVESGIPPFRGEGGIWNKYDPSFLYINQFFAHPTESWRLIKEIFFDFLGAAKPNAAHLSLARLEQAGILKNTITQNIDDLHRKAGSTQVVEFHGNTHSLICTRCGSYKPVEPHDLTKLPPACPECTGLLKPDFVFFGEAIPSAPSAEGFREAEMADVVLVIGTTGEVVPACNIPIEASRRGATIIEINAAPSRFTHSITDIFLQGKATAVMDALLAELRLP